MDRWLTRTTLVLGEENMEKLKNSTVAIIGVGGVGGAAAEAVCRAGVGRIVLVDNDTIDETNLNRQIVTNRDNIGKSKCAEAKKRFLSINPNCEIITKEEFILPDNCDFLFDLKPDFIIDAIDTVTAKLHLAQQCHEQKIGLIASLGTGNRIDPTKFVIGDIGDTAGSGCPLARVMRRELRKRNVDKLRVVYSTEIPTNKIVDNENPNGRHSPASISFVPPVAGYILASEAIRYLTQK